MYRFSQRQLIREGRNREKKYGDAFLQDLLRPGSRFHFVSRIYADHFCSIEKKKQKSIIERTRNFSKDFFYFEVLKTQEVKY